MEERLVREIDGFRIFHLACACGDQPGDDQPGDDAGTDPANPNDDACCGDEADGKRPCRGYVQKIVQANGIVTYQLVCGGDCPDGQNCRLRRSVNHHGGVREWCGCDDQESRRCHIVLYRPGEGEGGGEPKVFCAGACPDGTACRIKEEVVRVIDGHRIIRYTCDCPEDDQLGDDQPGDDQPGDDVRDQVSRDRANAAARARRLQERTRLMTDMRLRARVMPQRGAKWFCLEFDGAVTDRYRVLVSEDLLNWQDAGEASEVAPGQFEWIDGFEVKGQPRYYMVEKIEE